MQLCLCLPLFVVLGPFWAVFNFAHLEYRRNLFNEWYVRDSSRKVRAVFRAKAERGERLGARAPYGYRRSEDDRNRLVVDEEAAAIVRRIFAMCAGGMGPSQIARQLKSEQLLCPAVYAYQKFGIAHSSMNLE